MLSLCFFFFANPVTEMRQFSGKFVIYQDDINIGLYFLINNAQLLPLKN